MSRKKNKKHMVRRNQKLREPKKSLFVSVEGKNTEAQYLEIVKKLAASANIDRDFVVRVLPSGFKSAPKKVLGRMSTKLEDIDDDLVYEAWLVVDRNHWPEKDLNMLYKWTQKNLKYHLAVSNPYFEVWLLLHFEEGKKVTHENCRARFGKYHKNYNKNLESGKFNLEAIRTAIKRAQSRIGSDSKNWPRLAGQTTVYRLVEKLLP